MGTFQPFTLLPRSAETSTAKSDNGSKKEKNKDAEC
jgi:hypothetical protein